MHIIMMFILALLSARVLKLNTKQYMFSVVVAVCQRAPSEQWTMSVERISLIVLLVPMVQSNRDFENMAFMANMAN